MPRKLLRRPRFRRRKEHWQNVQVHVRDNNVDQALRALKKKMQREGIFREMKLRRNYEKPSEKRAREQAEAVRRTRQDGAQAARARRLLTPPDRGPAAVTDRIDRTAGGPASRRFCRFT